MISFRARGTSAVQRRLGLLLAVVSLLGLVDVARAQDIVRVEEDWELVIREPDPDTEAPQVTCVISPVGNLESLYTVFDLNLRHLPDYAAGGVQLQLWNNVDMLKSSSSNRGALLQSAGEKVTWTQAMSLQEGVLLFQVINGNSQTWGSFGGGVKLLVGQESGLENLNQYDSAVTVANSGIGYSGNRVTSLILKKVRVYAASGEFVEDAAAKVVHQHE